MSITRWHPFNSFLSTKGIRLGACLALLCAVVLFTVTPIAEASDLPPALPPTSIRRLQDLLPAEKTTASRMQFNLSYNAAINAQIDITNLENEWSNGGILGLPGTLEFSDEVIERGRQDVRSVLKTPEERPVPLAMRAAQAAAWEFHRRFMLGIDLNKVNECLDREGTEQEKTQCILSQLPALGAEVPFTVLSAHDQLNVVRSAIALVPQQAPRTDDFARLTQDEFWIAGIGLFKAWNRVAESESAVLSQFKNDAEKIRMQLEGTLSDFNKRRYRLENDAKRIVESTLKPGDPAYRRYVDNTRNLLQDQLTLEGITSGLIPPSTINLAGLPDSLQNLGKQLTTSSQSAMLLLEDSARGALTDLIPSADALPGVAVEVLGLPAGVGTLVNVLQGGDPTQLLTGPILEAVGLPPELGGMAVAIGTGNVVGAITGFADLAGISLGGLMGGGGGGKEMAEVRKELAEIRQQLAEISAKLEVIDHKLDALRDLVIANHAEVMAKLEVLGEDLDYIRRANRDALGKHTRNCDAFVSRVKKARSYRSLEQSLGNEAVGPFVRCWETVEDTASQLKPNSVFTLGLSEGAQVSRENYSRKYLAPHVQLFRDAFESKAELERATLLLGAGPHTLKSVARRNAMISSLAVLEGRQLFASEVLEPKKILDYEAVELFFESALLATSLRPFINLVTKRMIPLDCALDPTCLEDTAIPNEIQMMEVLEGCLKLAETGVAQTAVLDGDLVLPFAVKVIQDPQHEAYENLIELMKRDEIFARNVALAVMTTVLNPIGSVSAPEPIVGALADQVEAHPNSSVAQKVLGSLYSFAVETASPAMMLRLIKSGDPKWDIDFFVKIGPGEPEKHCAHVHEGLGLLMRLPNGICLPVPQIEELQQGALKESPDSHAFRRLRSRILDEIVGYQYRKAAPIQARKWFDAMSVVKPN